MGKQYIQYTDMTQFTWIKTVGNKIKYNWFAYLTIENINLKWFS